MWCGAKGSFLLVYTLMWLVCALSILTVFRLAKRTFLYLPDGAYQHYSAYEYICNALRGGKAGYGFFNYTLGQGADVLTTLNSYDFTDPVCWLTALLPGKVLTRYTLMIFIKLYLIGLSFGLYCRVTARENRYFNALGAICYTFSGAILFTLARHPNYISWAYYFPLIMAGAERPVFRCGGMYMDVALEAGSHEIEMRYVTPGLRAGAMISGGVALLITLLVVLDRKRTLAYKGKKWGC